MDRLNFFDLNHDVVDEIISLSEQLLSKTNEVNLYMTKSNPDYQPECILTSTEDFVISHLNALETRYKRNLLVRTNQYYVPPDSLHVDNTSINDCIQYVSITKTLTALFKSEEFKTAYFDFNNNHNCVDGVYERFCCGSKFKENKLFQSEKKSIQLQIYIDDFELCAALKTKSHKVCGLYCTIYNFSPKFTSQSRNMYLISLCDSKIVKQFGCNAVLEQFVNDVKFLETQGVPIGNNVMLKGTIVQAPLTI